MRTQTSLPFLSVSIEKLKICYCDYCQVSGNRIAESIIKGHFEMPPGIVPEVNLWTSNHLFSQFIQNSEWKFKMHIESNVLAISY